MSIHPDTDPFTPIPGVDRLRKYNSQARSKRLAEVLSSLNRAVVKPATDAHNVSWLLDLGVSFKPEENRSVTGEDWAFESLRKYGKQPTTAGFSVGDGRRANLHPTTGSTGGDGTTQGSIVRARASAEDTRRSGSVQSKGPVPSDLRSPHRGVASGVRVDGVKAGAVGGPYSRAAYRAALSSVRRALGAVGGRRRVLSLEVVVDTLVHDNSFSSLPYLSSNDLAKAKGLRLAERIRSGERGFDPYLFGRRVQFGVRAGNGVVNPKTRLVWMAAIATTILGQSYSEPIQGSLARKRPFTWGLTSAERGAIISSMRGSHKFSYELDFSKFDACVPEFIIMDIFKLIAEKLDMTDVEEDCYWRYANDFVHSRIVMPDGYIYQVHQGIPSGATFTSLVGSLINLLVSNYSWFRLTGRTLSNEQLLVMGDDSLIMSDQCLELDDIALMAAELNFTVNPDKSGVRDNRVKADPSTSPYFVGHHWHKGRPNRPKQEVKKHIWFTERHHAPDKAWSLVRLGGFALSSKQGYEVLLELMGQRYQTRDVVALLSLYLSMVRHSASEIESGQWRVEWPGEIRRRIYAEGWEAPKFLEGKGLDALLYGDSL
uniref:RNA-dependent RNA polymerase n=1 Tax=Apple partiti-like virus 1 TaxID=2709552 RepID=A0A6C0X1T1_9VIRU|nr:MAG: RNA-dependent RNA polymerase [Apple partiti-like virus 1]